MITEKKYAVVTGASSGIGEATVRTWCARGWRVLAVARREDRLAKLAAETGAEPLVCDITCEGDVARLVSAINGWGGLDVLVNNAGGARGLDPVESGSIEQWQWMYEANVIGTLRVTQALLPTLRQGSGGDIVVVTSTAAHGTYEGGAGYVAAKHAERIIANNLRLELNGEPIRVIEIAPGMVQTEEFSLNRLGSRNEADDVYAGVDHPLTADDIAEALTWTVTRPAHVNIDSLIIRPVAQASNTKVARD